MVVCAPPKLMNVCLRQMAFMLMCARCFLLCREASARGAAYSCLVPLAPPRTLHTIPSRRRMTVILAQRRHPLRFCLRPSFLGCPPAAPQSRSFTLWVAASQPAHGLCVPTPVAAAACRSQATKHRKQHQFPPAQAIHCATLKACSLWSPTASARCENVPCLGNVRIAAKVRHPSHGLSWAFLCRWRPSFVAGLSSCCGTCLCGAASRACLAVTRRSAHPIGGRTEARIALETIHEAPDGLDDHGDAPIRLAWSACSCSAQNKCCMWCMLLISSSVSLAMPAKLSSPRHLGAL